MAIPLYVTCFWLLAFLLLESLNTKMSTSQDFSCGSNGAITLISIGITIGVAGTIPVAVTVCCLCYVCHRMRYATQVTWLHYPTKTLTLVTRARMRSRVKHLVLSVCIYIYLYVYVYVYMCICVCVTPKNVCFVSCQPQFITKACIILALKDLYVTKYAVDS